MSATSAALSPMKDCGSLQPVVTMVLAEVIDRERHSDREVSNSLDTETSAGESQHDQVNAMTVLEHFT